MPLKTDEPKEWEFSVHTPAGMVPLKVRQINSSNINWVGWPAEGGQALLFVEFKGGGRYVYNGVSRQLAVACAYAESTGSFFAKKIKPKYEATKIR